MANFLTDNPDLRYYLEKGIDWARLAALTERGYKPKDGFSGPGEALDFYRDVASMVGELAANEIAPRTAELDRKGVRFENGEVVFPEPLAGIAAQIAELGLHGLMVPRELGGMNAPVLLHFLAGEMLARGDVSVMVHHGFHGGMAMTMFLLSVLEGSTEIDPATGAILRTRFGDEIAEVAAGKAWGSMDITEPDAGSDMAALRAAGSRGPDGRWRVSGQKIFITSGHGKYHFVIARTEKPATDDPEEPKAGLGGLSMFLVPAFRDGPEGRTRLATLDRVEEKLGHHSSATVAITFEDTPAELLGQPGQGFRYMLEIMNHARLGVGFESIGLCEAAYRLARDYAAERRAMGKTIDRHEMIADLLDEMEIDIVGLRALAFFAGFEEELAHKLPLFGAFVPAEGDAGERARKARQHAAAARRATPLLKYLAAEKAVEMARRCLQIHGGNGYMKEYGAEKLLRDALVLPIYEGTSQIQSLMAMKDTLGSILKKPQDFALRLATTRWRSLSAKDPLERRVAALSFLTLSAERQLLTRTLADKWKGIRHLPIGQWPKAVWKDWNPKRDFAFAMLHAERLTRLLADELIAEALLEQARRHPERRVLLERYLERAEPRARFLHDEILNTGGRLLAELAARKAPAQAGSASAGRDRTESKSPPVASAVPPTQAAAADPDEAAPARAQAG